MGTPNNSAALAAKARVEEYFDEIAVERDAWIKKNSYYYEDLKSFYRFNIPPGKRVLEIGSGTGEILAGLKPSRGVGIDLSQKMVEIAQKKYPQLCFRRMDAEALELEEKFDAVIISDTLGYLSDIQLAFKRIHKVVDQDSRIVMNFHSFLWQPFLILAESLGLKMPQQRLNWVTRHDLLNFLTLERYEVIKSGRRFLFPKRIPFVSFFLNKYIAHFPFFNLLCVYGYIVARKPLRGPLDGKPCSVTVVVPARNEKANIEHAVRRIPKMGSHTEIIFIEGGSTDDTLGEVKRVCSRYSDVLDVKYAVQDGKGKGDAVRKGFSMAAGDILMILDADLTVPPEELPKFYDAIATGCGEFINGSRLVYPLEKEAMRVLNILGNKFFSMAFTWLLSQRLKDTLCGTKVIFKRHYEALISGRSYFGDFDPFGDFDLIFGAAKLNLKIMEIPIHYRAREYGHTNISRFHHGWLLLKMVFFAMNKIKFL